MKRGYPTLPLHVESEGVGGVLPPILDACCGSRMFWFDRSDARALYMDKREEQHVLCDGRELKIAPDVVADFTEMPFPNEVVLVGGCSIRRT
jgi:hypothetical protein